MLWRDDGYRKLPATRTLSVLPIQGMRFGASKTTKLGIGHETTNVRCTSSISRLTASSLASIPSIR